MEIIIILSPDNTIQEEDVAANLSITVDITKHSKTLQKYNRFYVSSRVVVPVSIKGTKKIVDLFIRDYFNREDILYDGEMYYVIQKGYIEGVIQDGGVISVSSKIWRYDLKESM